jgi:hypothetical protein
VNAELEVEFAGQTAYYKLVPLQLTNKAMKSTSPGPSSPRSPISKSILPRCLLSP